MKRTEQLVIGATLSLMLLLVSGLSVQGQLGKKQSADITLEFKSNARLHFNVTAQGETDEVGGEYSPFGGLSGDTPFTSLSGSLQVSSPSLGQIDFDAETSVTLSADQISAQQEMGLNMLSKDLINNGMEGFGFEGLNSFAGKSLSSVLSQGEGMGMGEVGELPSEIANLTVNELSCTSFSWNKPNLTVGITGSVSGSVFENEKLREWLPIDLEFSLDVSETTSEKSFEITASASASKGEVDLEISTVVSGGTQTTELTVDGYVELPRTDGTVQFDQESFGEFLGIQNAMGQGGSSGFQNLQGEDVSVTLKVPSDAEVSGLPSDAQTTDSGTYTWTGDSAASALESITTGQTDTEVSYNYEPSSESELPWTYIGIGAVIAVVLGGLFVAKSR
ncbi:hypothetical protein AKJ53_00805 [candidate division MSBL1 archaeon SCGC-AAA382F02]|uniref:Uncharacterized protein n=1 Tax=candidate division MSBL1 archaeon SCGC-AAA382F02 TaxID=1698282 RepID=A0A133VII5_9EURY|nr:hypothetical protein AKJ53_00805 [candidate division MSBL1 archaeon SCGC-AAA382F02]